MFTTKDNFTNRINKIEKFLRSYNKDFVWLSWSFPDSSDEEIFLIRLHSCDKTIQKAFVRSGITEIPFEIIKGELDYTIRELQESIYEDLNGKPIKIKVL